MRMPIDPNDWGLMGQERYLNLLRRVPAHLAHGDHLGPCGPGEGHCGGHDGGQQDGGNPPDGGQPDGGPTP